MYKDKKWQKKKKEEKRERGKERKGEEERKGRCRQLQFASWLENALHVHFCINRPPIQMIDLGITPDVTLYNVMLKAVATRKDLSAAQVILRG